MPEILTPEEKAALAQSFDALGEVTPSDQPTLAVFPSVSQLRAEETALLHEQLEAWSEQVAADLGRQLQASCAVDFARIQTQPFTALTRETDLCYWAALDGAPRNGVLLTIPGDLAASLCERSFGGPLEPVAAHSLSVSETRLMQQLTRGWLGRLSDHWRGHSVQPECRPTGMPISDPDEALGWIRFTVELRCGGVTGNISLSMAPSTARLTQGRTASHKPAAINTADLLSRLGQIPLDVSGILGHAKFSLDELANLRVGDVIFLDQRVEELVEVQICGRPRFNGRVGLNGQTVALELVSSYSENKNQ